MESLSNRTISGPRNGKPSVASVTVTWNGRDTIEQHLKALADQSIPLTEVIVVDNASEDGTPGLVERYCPMATLISMRENQGVGGGFSAGLELAARGTFDWFWLFDQDSVPSPPALEELLNALKMLPGGAEKVGVLAPTVVEAKYGIEHRAALWRHGFMPLPEERARSPLCFVDSVMFSGSLIRRDVVEKAGLPRRDFFMDYADHEYNLRIRRCGYQILHVRKSVLYHCLGDVRPVKRFWRRTVRYYSFHPPWRHYFFSRNETFMSWHLYGSGRSRLVLVVRMLKRVPKMICLEERGVLKARAELMGFWDGLRGNLSRDLSSLPACWKSERQRGAG